MWEWGEEGAFSASNSAVIINDNLIEHTVILYQLFPLSQNSTHHYKGEMIAYTKHFFLCQQ